eukprot:gene200-4446_t
MKKIKNIFKNNKKYYNTSLSMDDFIKIKSKENTNNQKNKNLQPKEFNLEYERQMGNLFDIEEYIKLIKEFKGIDLVVMDLKEKTNYTDYMVFVTGNGQRHMKTIASKLVEMIKRKNLGLNVCIEGAECDDWMLVDGGNVIVQIFSEDGRNFYDLERKFCFEEPPKSEDISKLLEEEK